MTPPPQPRRPLAHSIGLVITNATKLGGLILAMDWGLTKSGNPRLSIVLAVAALMMAGAQGLETFLERMFGNGK